MTQQQPPTRETRAERPSGRVMRSPPSSVCLPALLAAIAGCGGERSAPGPELQDGIELGFTGIAIDFEGEPGIDYVYERLWHDRETDDDVVVYLRSSVAVVLAHNADNVLGANTPWAPGLHPGHIVYRVDGDGLRGYDGNIYHAAPAYGNPIDPPLDEIQFQYERPFTLEPFQGRLGPGPDFHRGVEDEFGDEWHVLAFWDVDPQNTTGERDDQTNDGKLVPIVLDPRTPIVTFEAPEGDEFYTTPPKLYDTPHIHPQTTYLTAGVTLRLHNLAADRAAAIRYQVDDGPVRTYDGVLTAGALFGAPDTVHRLTYWLGEDGPRRVRQIHFVPAQPAPEEVHPRLFFPSPAALAEAQAVVAAGGPAAEALLAPEGYIAIPDPPVDFRTGLRYLRPELFRGGYYYQTKRLAAVIREYARRGVLLRDETLMRRAADGLLFLYTIDPLGCESFDGRAGGPCQERCMYSDGRVTIDAALAYDLLAGVFTRQAGFASGLTPIEHLKIRDNLAGEAAMMVKYPTSAPEPFWRTSRSSGSPREVQLEMFIASLAMAMPSYDSPHFGTSGADGATEATHRFAPLEDAAVSWFALHDRGYVEHPDDSDRFRYSALHNAFDEDGVYVGDARDGYLDMMHEDAVPFLVYRHNFDGHHDPRFEGYLRQRILQRYPFNGVLMPQGFFEGGYQGRDAFLARLVRAGFPDAPLYRWALDHPVPIEDATPADPDLPGIGPDRHSVVARSVAVFSSDLGDPDAVMLRMRVFPPSHGCQSGTFQTTLAGAFNLSAYGERLVIEKAGYHQAEEYDYGTSQMRKSVVLVDEHNDPSYLQVRGRFVASLLTGPLDYAELRTDRAASPDGSSYVAAGVDLVRRLLFLDRRWFLIVDTLAAETGNHRYDWLLQGATGGGAGRFDQDPAARTALWTKPGGQRLFAQLLTEAAFIAPAPTENDYIDFPDDGFPEPLLRAYAEGDVVHFLAVLYPLDDGMPLPVVTPLAVPGAVAAAIAGGAVAGSVVVALRTGTAPLAATSGFLCETDGRLCVYRLDEEGDPVALALVDGTTARVGTGDYRITLPVAGTAALVDATGSPILVEAERLPPQADPRTP
ncbi:MAG: hypothetical protein JXB32_11290 [Deltaproteobacteria bacterium]|nr:hypothetical protein [Deltaproteobacteria bacterium]